MLLSIILVFSIGYILIAFEESIKINKTATAILTGVLCWTIYIAAGSEESSKVVTELGHHLGSISEILFFLLGAMTIVELIDAHQGFSFITNRIQTKNSVKLLWIISFTAFFLSAILDNLTTAIVMVSLLRKLLPVGEKRKLYAGMVIIAANAGGAWSPIGDVTTTMLWIGGQLTSLVLVREVFLPSLFNLLVPLAILSFWMRNDKSIVENESISEKTPDGSRFIFFLGLAVLLFVPVFKTITHLPPYMGMLSGLAIVWIASEIIHKDKDEEERKPLTASYALSRIDSSSVLFFLGILISIACLETTGLLTSLSLWMSNTIGNLDLIVTFIGLASAVIDNVPLVAASMGMYSMEQFPVDHRLWEMMAYCAGTGGSILIIGSAAGVAVMGMEKIDFVWYFKRISGLAFMGYVAGLGVYLLQTWIFH